MDDSIRVNLAWSFLSRYINMVLQFATIVILARLLTPEEIGIYSIAVAFFSIGQILRDFGISEYITQEKELTRDKIASAFTISLFICWSLAGLFIVIGPAVSEFYERPELIELFYWLVGNFLLIPFGTLTLSLLKRGLQFKKLMIINFASIVVYSVVAVTAAYLGYSYLSLAWASVSGTAATIIMAMLYRPADQPWMPSLSEVRQVGAFGWRMSYAQMAGHLNKSAPELIIGKFQGAHEVAIFGKAMSTTLLFTEMVFNGLSKVIEPVFAQKNRESNDLKPSFLHATAALTVIAWPFFGFFMLMAEPIVLFLYGDQWGESVPLLRIVCIAAMLFFTFNLTTRVLVSRGKAVRLANIQTQFLIVSVVGILIAVQYDLYAVAGSIIVERLYRAWVLSGDLRRELGVNVGDFIPILRKGFIVTVSSLVGPLLVLLVNTPSQWHIFIQLLVAGSSWGLSWLLAVYLVNHPLKVELGYLFASVKKKLPVYKRA
ncbi:MAG: O-antigen/teichoic acid export membrane protein [Motiliproteus sp.]|jgi:O-antigen/teichoic acid export membrane protein